MTYHDNPGSPSGVGYGCQTAAGEEWAAPGIGQRMVDYLRRKAATTTPKKRQHLKLAPDKPASANAAAVRPGMVKATTETCPDCQKPYLRQWAVQRRCPACQHVYNARRPGRGT